MTNQKANYIERSYIYKFLNREIKKRMKEGRQEMVMAFDEVKIWLKAMPRRTNQQSGGIGKK